MCKMWNAICWPDRQENGTEMWKTFILCHQKHGSTHFNSKGHDHSLLRIQVIEKVFPNTDPFRLERERYWIQTLQTQSPKGLNKQT